MVNILKKALSLSFDEAVKKVEEISQQFGFAVLATKALDKIFYEKLGIENYPRYTMILVCNPKYAKEALDVSFNVGLLFPCSFVVYEENNKVIVAHSSIMKIAPEIGFAPEDKMQSVIEMTGEAIQKIWKAL